MSGLGLRFVFGLWFGFFWGCGVQLFLAGIVLWVQNKKPPGLNQGGYEDIMKVKGIGDRIDLHA